MILAFDLVFGPYGHLFRWIGILIIVFSILWSPLGREFSARAVSSLVLFVLLFVILNIHGIYHRIVSPSEEEIMAEKQEQLEEKQKRSEEEAKKKKQDEYASEFSEFKSGEAQEVQAAIREIKALEGALVKQVGGLKATIEGAGRNVEDDADYVKWRDHLAAVRKDIKELEESLVSAFIEFKKFKLQTTTEDRKKFKELMDKGAAHAKEVRERYISLKEEIGGEK